VKTLAVAKANVPSAPASISGATKVCPSTTINYSVTTVANTTYTWTAPANSTILSGQGTGSVSIAYASGFTTGSLSVKAVNCGGTSSAKTISITKTAVPSIPGTISGPTVGLCKQVAATYSVAAVSNATSYTWTVPAGAVITSGQGTNTIIVNFTNATLGASNSLSVKANNCGGSSLARSLSFSAIPAVPASISGNTNVCTGSQQIYSINAVSGASNYIWTVPSGSIINSGQGTLSINMNFGPTASTTRLITVKASNTCGTSTAKSLNVVSSICVRESLDATNITVYPNPASSFVNVSFNVEQSQQATISLRDAAGRIVYSEAIDATAGLNNQEVELSNLASGVYFVQLQTATATEISRLIVE
jgi:hypothetical protein